MYNKYRNKYLHEYIKGGDDNQEKIESLLSIDNHDEEETISIHEEEIEPEPSVERENVHNRELHGLCIICKENKPTTLLLPCKHFGLCDHCTEELQRRNLEMQRPDEEFGYVVDYSRCPLDRISIEEFLKVIPT
ncbi:hypothetical protein FQR65_LT19980 [Abscondita terminalis]|nr:hypothetical protein FQR65_LT19980 [Abscondita terminalis]